MIRIEILVSPEKLDGLVNLLESVGVSQFQVESIHPNTFSILISAEEKLIDDAIKLLPTANKLLKFLR